MVISLALGIMWLVYLREEMGADTVKSKELASLREQLQARHEGYEQKIQAMDDRLNRMGQLWWRSISPSVALLQLEKNLISPHDLQIHGVGSFF